MHGTHRGWLFFTAAMLGLWAAPVSATTLVYDNDAELAWQSQAVVLGKVISVAPEYEPAMHSVRTRVTIALESLVGGQVQGGTIELTELGGDVPGLSEKVFGAPSYRVGERVLIFLQRDARGRLHTTGLSAGKYTVEASSTGMWVARREYRGARVLRPRSRRFDHDPQPEERPLNDVIAEVQHAFAARGLATPRVELSPPGVEDLEYSAPFTLLSNARWFSVDAGSPVSFVLDVRGLQALGPSATEQAVMAAMAAWSGVPDSLLRFEIAGKEDPIGFEGCSGPNSITFDDPFGEVGDPTNCRGILALGGYCSSKLGVVRNGVPFDDISVAKIVFNNGWDGCGIWTPCNVEEVATHELGHTIGLGHSSDANATMAAYAHFDGRCAALTTDDVNGLRFLYGNPRPDLVFLPRSPVSLRIAAGAVSASKEIVLTIRNADRLGSSSAPVETLVEVRDGTCPAGTVRAVDTDPKTPGAQNTVMLGSRETKTVRVLVQVNRGDVSTPAQRSVHRCVLEATVSPTAYGGEDQAARNNVIPIVLDLRDGNDLVPGRSQTLRETTLSSMSPVRIVLPTWMPVQTRVVRFRVRNSDQGIADARAVTVNVDPGDCPPGLVAELDMSPAAGDQHTVSVKPGGTVVGQLVLTPPVGSVFTPSSLSPFRCTLWLTVVPGDGEVNLSDNTSPLIVDVIDHTDF